MSALIKTLKLVEKETWFLVWHIVLVLWSGILIFNTKQLSFPVLALNYIAIFAFTLFLLNQSEKIKNKK